MSQNASSPASAVFKAFSSSHTASLQVYQSFGVHVVLKFVFSQWQSQKFTLCIVFISDLTSDNCWDNFSEAKWRIFDGVDSQTKDLRCNIDREVRRYCGVLKEGSPPHGSTVNRVQVVHLIVLLFVCIRLSDQ